VNGSPPRRSDPVIETEVAPESIAADSQTVAPAADNQAGHQLDRALPGQFLDRIRDGLSPAELRAGGARAVWKEVIRASNSAVQRGWRQWELAALLTEPRSTLGRQLVLSRPGHQLTDKQLDDQLVRAWRKAERWVAGRPPPADKVAIVRHLEAVAAALEHVELGHADRAVMAYALRVARTHGTLRPALPPLGVAAETGLGERTVRNSLRRLERRGLVEVADRGRSSGDAPRRRAACYRLLLPKAGMWDPQLQTYGTPSPGAAWDPPGHRGNVVALRPRRGRR
jgi:hypothetical protein